LINVENSFGYLLNPMLLNKIDFYYAWLCNPEEKQGLIECSFVRGCSSEGLRGSLAWKNQRT